MPRFLIEYLKVIFKIDFQDRNIPRSELLFCKNTHRYSFIDHSDRIVVRGANVRIAPILLLVLVGTIPLAGINPSFAEKVEIPDWVKSTLVLWSDGEITNEEFVRAIDYLSEKGIVKLSSTDDKEIQRQIAYLKAKTEVFKEETKQLREENEEYRILLKSQEINKSAKIPTSMSKIFDEYQALQIELKSLRETNKHLSKQIDSWISSNGIPEQSVVSNDSIKPDINSENIKQLNNLKVENKENLEKIKMLEEQAKSYQNNIELLKLENQNKMQLIAALKDRNQDNRDSVNELIQNEEKYESMVAQLRNENFIQKQKLVEYENKIKSLDQTFEALDNTKEQTEQKLVKLEKQNSYYTDTINELEGINKEQKAELISLTNELAETNKIVGTLSEQIQGYESKIQSLNDESTVYKNKISKVEAEKSQYQDKITKLEQENIEQRKTIIGIMNDAQESTEFASVLNSRMVSFQETIDRLEAENSNYKSRIFELENENGEKNTSLITMKNEIDDLNQLVSNLNSKLETYQNTIQKLESENDQYKSGIMSTQNKKSSEHESLIRQLQADKSKQQEAITLMQVEMEESNKLIDTLNSKIVSYEKQIGLFEQENSKYRNEITALKLENKQKSNSLGDAMNQNDNMIQILSEENQRYQNTISELKEENKLLQKQVNIVSNENSDNLILVTEMESENSEMKKKIELLKSELEQKYDQIESLKNIQLQKDEQLSQIQEQKPAVVHSDNGNISSIQEENENLLVELNYLKAKSLVIDEEIEVLRAENEEYRVLLNMLKKEQAGGFENMNFGSLDEAEGQGVIVYKTLQSEKTLPDDWIAKVKNSKEYQVYVEPSPRWSYDVSNEVAEALEFWKQTADVEFEIVNAPSFGIITIDWEKELRNGYDGYVVGNTNISIGMGSSECDGKWKPYSSESIKEVLIHELGHTVGLEHAASKSNIMYPMIHDAKFAPINEKFTIPQDGSVFIKGCSFSADPSYKYNIQVDDSKKVNMFFVPSSQEKYKVDSGEEFNYYSDMNCMGLSKSSKTGVCRNVADSGGLLIINSDNEGSVSVSVHLEEQ